MRNWDAIVFWVAMVMWVGFLIMLVGGWIE